jgi:aspartyl-tRNA synthetase
MEMAFAGEDQVMEITEAAIKTVFAKIAKVELDTTTFPRMTYQQAMASYGSDKPDLRLAAEVLALFLHAVVQYLTTSRYTQ